MPMPAEKINENNTKVIRMTSGQKSYLPNEFFDACSRTRIPGEQMQVLMAIVRKTWCWGKDEDKISLSQLASMTGLSRSHVQRAIKPLIERNIIGVLNNGYTEAQTIGINSNFDSWCQVYPKVGTVPKNEYKGVPNIGQNLYPNLGPTKDTIQKTIKNNSSCPDSPSQDAEPKNPEPEKPAKKAKTLVFDTIHLDLADLLHDEIIKNKPNCRFSSNYREQWADIARLMIDRDKRKANEIRDLIFWCQADDFWSGNILSMGNLREKFDRLQSQMQRKGKVISFQPQAKDSLDYFR